MDAVTGDRGQALVLAVLVLAVAAVTIVGLRAAQERILADVRERRAGEAAIEAAGAALADAQLGFVGSLRDELGGRRTLATRAEIETFAADPLVAERARTAAEALSTANGGPAVGTIQISLGGRTLELAMTVGAHQQRAAIEAACCLR